jgi:two-component system sensor histidine kinase HydH
MPLPEMARTRRPSLDVERQRALLVQLARVGTRSMPLAELVEQLLALVVESFELFAAHMHLIEGEQLVFAGSFGGEGSQAGLDKIRRLPMDDTTLSGQAVLRRATVSSTVDNWPVRTRELLRERGIKHGAAVPLVVQDRVIGSFYSLRKIDRAFSKEELELLEACASHAATAVEHARLLAAERRRSEDLKVLLDVGRLITGSLDLDQILEASATHLARITDASHSFLWLLEPGGTLRGVVTSAKEHQDHFRQVRLTLDAPSLAARAVVAQKPVREQAALTSPNVNQNLNARYQMKSLLALPLMLRGEPVGAAVIGDAVRQREWTEGEVESATVVSGQIAVAVANARLFEDLKQSYDQLTRAQIELVKRERLAALGELSAVVAHEVRNPLGVIYNSMSALKRLLNPTGEAAGLFEMIDEEAERIDTIVADLLEFARPHAPELKPESLPKVLQGAVQVITSARGSAGVRISVCVPENFPKVRVDERMLRQALLNLLVNAVQAMPRGGGDVQVVLTLEPHRGQPFVRIDVTDSGPGVPAALTDRVFQPFVTTKATGSGLGLAVVKRIVEAHHGDVELTSEPGRGATFTLWLPSDKT